jgi:hypothetical protein
MTRQYIGRVIITVFPDFLANTTFLAVPAFLVIPAFRSFWLSGNQLSSNFDFFMVTALKNKLKKERRTMAPSAYLPRNCLFILLLQGEKEIDFYPKTACSNSKVRDHFLTLAIQTN